MSLLRPGVVKQHRVHSNSIWAILNLVNDKQPQALLVFDLSELCAMHKQCFLNGMKMYVIFVYK